MHKKGLTVRATKRNSIYLIASKRHTKSYHLRAAYLRKMCGHGLVIWDAVYAIRCKNVKLEKTHSVRDNGKSELWCAWYVLNIFTFFLSKLTHTHTSSIFIPTFWLSSCLHLSAPAVPTKRQKGFQARRMQMCHNEKPLS